MQFISRAKFLQIHVYVFSSTQADPDLWGANVCRIMLDIVIPLLFAVGKVPYNRKI